jgi:hypothetical protein
MTLLQTLSLSGVLVLGCFSIIWFFIRRFFVSMDKRDEFLDGLTEKVNGIDKRVIRLEVLNDVV